MKTIKTVLTFCKAIWFPELSHRAIPLVFVPTKHPKTMGKPGPSTQQCPPPLPHHVLVEAFVHLHRKLFGLKHLIFPLVSFNPHQSVLRLHQNTAPQAFLLTEKREYKGCKKPKLLPQRWSNAWHRWKVSQTPDTNVQLSSYGQAVNSWTFVSSCSTAALLNS